MLPYMLDAAASARDVESAIRRFDESDLSAWSFTAEHKREQVTETLQFGPGKPSNRAVTLIAVDGHPPSAEALEAFAEQRSRMSRDDDAAESDTGLKLKDFIQTASLAYTRSDSNGDHFTFTPYFAIEGEPEAQDDLQGNLIFDPASGIIRKVEIFNEGVFKPRFGVKIETLHFSFQFQTLPDGTAAPEVVKAVVRGRAFMVAKFDQQEETRYRDFSRRSKNE